MDQNGKKPAADQRKDGAGNTKLRLAKTTLSIGTSLAEGAHERALQKAVLTGIKMAGTSPFKNPLASPVEISKELQKLGVGALTWTPEALCAEIDRQYNGWDERKVAEALVYFNKQGIIKTDVPQLVREKIYAIRVVATSDTAHTEWHVFEKVGGAFNDRTAKFGTVEPLSAAECAKTVAIMEDIRPDSYSDEVKIYIAACCHEAGLLTVEPVKWIAMSEPFLQRMNRDATGESLVQAEKEAIAAQFAKQKDSRLPREVEDSVVDVQTAKLIAIDTYAKELNLS